MFDEVPMKRKHSSAFKLLIITLCRCHGCPISPLATPNCESRQTLILGEKRLVRSEQRSRSLMKRYVTLRTTLQRLEEESEYEQSQYEDSQEDLVDEQA